jgi:hypothetical protein
MLATLPPRVPKKAKRASRWKSTAHRDFVRSFACCACGSTGPREFAHVRLGSGAGMGQKPDDWRGVPLCAGPHSNISGELGCHNVQHVVGEESFWRQYEERHGQTVEQLLEALIEASPRRAQIRQAQREREDG